MGSGLAIFRKDVGRLWPQIALFLALLPLAAVAGTGGALRGGEQEHLLGVVALLAAWSLMAGVILQEPLAGDRQYWLTRPISTGVLLAEKSLFVFLFVMLPVAITQVVVLSMLGLSPRTHFDALAWRQVFLIAQVILPAAALFSAGRSFTQVFLLAIAAVALVVLPRALFPEQFVLGWNAPGWFSPAFREALLALAGGVTLVALYQRCDPRLSWSMLAGLAAIFLLVTQIVWDDPPLATVAVTLDAPPARPRLPRPGWAELPIRIAGLPAQAEVMVGRLRLSVFGARIETNQAFLSDFADGRMQLILAAPDGVEQTPLRISGSGRFHPVPARRVGRRR